MLIPLHMYLVKIEELNENQLFSSIHTLLSYCIDINIKVFNKKIKIMNENCHELCRFCICKCENPRNMDVDINFLLKVKDIFKSIEV